MVYVAYKVSDSSIVAVSGVDLTPALDASMAQVQIPSLDMGTFPFLRWDSVKIQNGQVVVMTQSLSLVAVPVG